MSDFVCACSTSFYDHQSLMNVSIACHVTDFFPDIFARPKNFRIDRDDVTSICVHHFGLCLYHDFDFFLGIFRVIVNVFVAFLGFDLFWVESFQALALLPLKMTLFLSHHHQL